MAIVTLSVSKALWNFMSLGSKRKVKQRACNDDSERGLVSKIRRKIGINFSNLPEVNNEKVTGLQQTIIEFFKRDDVSRVCPDTKRMLKDPINAGEKVPVRYRLGCIPSLHLKFLTGSGMDCHV